MNYDGTGANWFNWEGCVGPPAPLISVIYDHNVVFMV